ncbi:hypothetical protein H072_1002 [Dactylellina haptotyla CBS 200.50]|uniref:Uncharacterized protein n=1 Tax=Dactylellina haptotyla (strain CBS 200.50) TaxID=1284197 RepID=S8APW4_DACHA|nr:hypothetical protein H072_1002 [Dactylellina haptotyla CBS 200.50]
MAAAIWRVSNHHPPQQQQGQHQSSTTGPSHSRSLSSPAAVGSAGGHNSASGSSGPSATGAPPSPPYYSDRDRDLEVPTDTDIPPSLPSPTPATSSLPAPSISSASTAAGSQSLVLLHSSSHRPIPTTPLRRPHTASGSSPLKLVTTTTNHHHTLSHDNQTSSSFSSYSPTTITSTSYATLSLLDAVGTGSGRRKLKEFPGLIPLSRYFIPPSASATPTAGNTPTTPTIPTFGTDNISKEPPQRIPDSEGSTTATPRVSSPTPSDGDNNNIDGNYSTASESIAAAFQPVAQRSTAIDGTTDMDAQPPVAIIGDPEPLMTQDLLNFYKNRLHELEKSSQQELLERISVLRGFLLEHHDATHRLERQLHELQDENTALSKELEDGIKHRVEMIALYKENEVLKEKIDQLSKAQEHNIYDPTPIPSPDPSVTGSIQDSAKEPHDVAYDRLQIHYEELVSQILNKFNEQAASRDSERHLANQNIDQLNDRCRRLETAVSDSLKDIIQERSRRVGLEEKLKETEEELNVSVFEMQSQIEIFERHINESRMSPVKEGDDQDEELDGSTDVLPPEMFDEVPDIADRPPSAMKRSQAGSPIRRKTPSPTKRRTPSPTNGPVVAFALELIDSGVQTEEDLDTRDVAELRRELSDMISERQAEELLIKTKKAEFEATYEKFAGIVEQARAQSEEFNILKVECEELRAHVEELLEQHDMDQEELLTRQTEIDGMFGQLEEALKQSVVDKQEITKANTLVEELKKQLEETKDASEDMVSVVKDDEEIKNLRLQLDEANREKSLDEETISKASQEIETLKEKVEALSMEHADHLKSIEESNAVIETLKERAEKFVAQHSDQVKEIEKSNIEIQGLKIQIETLTKQRSEDLDTISRANTEIKTLRARVDQETVESQRSMSDTIESLQAKLSEVETAKSILEQEKSRKEGDIKLLREQMQGLLKAQGNKEIELSRSREDLGNLKRRYDELVSDRKKDEEWRHENFMELEAVRQRLADVMRIKEQESTLHQRDEDLWKRKDEEQQAQLKEVNGRLAEMVLEINGRNDIMKGLNETVERLKLADEASSIKMAEAKDRIQALESEVQEEKRKVAVEATQASEKVKEAEEKKNEAEERKREIGEEVEILKATVQDLEERIRGYEVSAGADQDSGQRVQELEHQLAQMHAQIEKLVIEADMEVEAMEREIEDAKAHAVEVAQEANIKIDALEQEIIEMQQLAEAAQGEAKVLEQKLVETKSYAEKQVTAAENELKKLETQIKVEEAKASATITVANDRLAVLEKQIKTFEALKRHKAQDESDLHSLRTHVVKIERIALQFLPLEDSGMLNAIDELKKSHLETQQKHKKRRKKEMIMAEKCALQL